MARAGEEDLEFNYTAEFRTHPPPQAAGTVYFAIRRYYAGRNVYPIKF